MSLHYPPKEDALGGDNAAVRPVERGTVFLFGCIFGTLSVVLGVQDFAGTATVMAVPTVIFVMIALRGGKESVKSAFQIASMLDVFGLWS